MALYYEWWPPGAAVPIRFGQDPYILRDFEGVGSTATEPQIQKSPFQVGSSLVNTEIQSRTVSISIRLAPIKGGRSLDRLRADLVQALALKPAIGTESPETGRLRVHRPDMEVLELICVPRNSPQFSNDISGKFCDADIEFFAADPLWRDVEESRVTIGLGEGGTGFPIEMPLTFSGTVTEAIIYNDGNVPAPIQVLIRGEITTVRIINDTTGQTMEVTGLVAAGTSIRITTHFGRKEVKAIAADGSETSAMGRVNLDLFTFWQLQEGENRVRLEADAAAGGSAELTWRNRYAGV